MSLVEISRKALTFTLPNGLQLPIRWYGVFYLISYSLISWQAKEQLPNIAENDIQSIIDWGLLGGIIGGRLWYLVYRYLEDGIPLYIDSFHVWEGGMAFQGGILGAFVFATTAVYMTGNGKRYAKIFDVLAANAPIGIMFGRLGNFLNEEFMNPIFGLPSCLFSSITEGIIPFLILRYVPGIQKTKYVRAALFFIMYATIRFINDFFRTEDTYGPFKLSQYVCMFIAAAGCGLLFYALRRPRK